MFGSTGFSIFFMVVVLPESDVGLSAFALQLFSVFQAEMSIDDG